MLTEYSPPSSGANCSRPRMTASAYDAQLDEQERFIQSSELRARDEHCVRASVPTLRALVLELGRNNSRARLVNLSDDYPTYNFTFHL